MNIFITTNLKKIIIKMNVCFIQLYNNVFLLKNKTNMFS